MKFIIPITIFILSVCFIAPPLVEASCLACTTSAGVTVELKDGNTIRGYIAWNVYLINNYIGSKGKIVRPYHKDLAEKIKKVKLTAFQKWLLFINRDYQQKSENQKLKIDGLTVYGELQKIKYPFKQYVAVEEKTYKLESHKIRSIKANPSLKLKVDITGIDSLPLKDIKLLQTTKPRYTIEDSNGSTAADVYVVYGDTVTIDQLLNHLIYHSYSARVGEEILFNRKYVVTDGKYVGGRDIGDKKTEGIFKNYVKKVAEIKVILSEFYKSGNKDSKVRDKKKEIPSRFGKSLGDEKILRKLGIVKFSYAWD